MKKVVLLLFISLTSIAQNKSEKEISDMIFKAGKHLQKLEITESISLAENALRESTKIENHSLMAKSCNIIGLNFEEFYDYNKAIIYYKRGLDNAIIAQNDTVRSWIHNNLGNVYSYRKKEYGSGLIHYRDALILSRSINNDYEAMFTELNIASTYFSLNNYTEGLKYLKNTQKYTDFNNDIEAVVTTNSLYGDYYLHIKDYKKAEKYYLSVIDLMKDNDDIFLDLNVLEIYDDIARLYTEKGDHINANKYLTEYIRQKEEFYSKERLDRTKFSSLSLELSEAEADRKVKELFLLKARVINIALCVFLGIFILLLVHIARVNFRSRRDNQKLRELKHIADNAVKIKSQFISTITHEIRTPLYGIIGMIDIMEEEIKELKGNKYVKSLKFSTGHLLALINDILQIQKIEENKIVLEMSNINIKDMINSTIDSLQFFAANNDNKIIVDISDDVPTFIRTDKIRLTQILFNLMSNSLKFTKNGYVKIVVVSIDKKLKFKVIDNGTGIEKENIDLVFENFTQLSRKNDDYQGTGLGLPIVKKLVELLGGKIVLDSGLGIGTTVTFDIDYLEPELEMPMISKDEIEMNSFNILVVDDNKINQMVTKKTLGNVNMTSKSTGDGNNVLKMLEEEHYDAILMDLSMPIIDGYDTTKLIRSQGIDIPIIAFTAFDREEVLHKVLSSGMNDVVTKPIDKDEIYNIINELVVKKHS